jgi:hypothetical protein
MEIRGQLLAFRVGIKVIGGGLHVRPTIYKNSYLSYASIKDRQCDGLGIYGYVGIKAESSVADPTFPSRIPDPNILHPGSRIRIKEFEYFNPKKWFPSTRKYDPGFSSRIPDPDPDFLPVPDPGSRGQKGTGSGIRIRNTGGKISI